MLERTSRPLTATGYPIGALRLVVQDDGWYARESLHGRVDTTHWTIDSRIIKHDVRPWKGNQTAPQRQAMLQQDACSLGVIEYPSNPKQWATFIGTDLNEAVANSPEFADQRRS
jgi:hypothetical protein